MRLHRFFINQLIKVGTKTVAVIDKSLIHQWKNVFRLKSGDALVLLDNSGTEFQATIQNLDKTKAELNIFAAKIARNMPAKNIFLLSAIIKKDNFEWVLEKGTELGVSHFVPLLTDRTEKKDINVERGEKIIREASEQSERGRLPTLYKPMKLKEALKNIDIDLVAFDPDGAKFGPEKIKLFKKIGLLIGPEGGWSEAEIELFKDYKIPVYSIGAPVLRAETAAIVVAALVGLSG